MTHKASSMLLSKEFWIMSYFECRLNRIFWRSKKVVQVVQNVGGGNLDKILNQNQIIKDRTFLKLFWLSIDQLTIKADNFD